MNIMYEILFTRKAADSIMSLRDGYKEKVKSVLTDLKDNPFSHPYRKIRGETNIYRIRVGKYRILYEIDEGEKKISILKLDIRSKAYKY